MADVLEPRPAALSDADGLHEALDRYEAGGGWAEGLPPAAGPETLAALGGREPRFALAGSAHAERASELLSSLSHARAPRPPPARRGARRDAAASDARAERPPRDALTGDARPDDPPEATGRFIGAYSPAARKRRIARFNAKRPHRVWTRKVKYDVRKNFADTRMRVKGRFVKKEDEDLLRELVSLC